jgi:hypothetical protein
MCSGSGGVGVQDGFGFVGGLDARGGGGGSVSGGERSLCVATQAYDALYVIDTQLTASFLEFNGSL